MMIDFSELKKSKGWYNEKGESNDVVISSRIRLSRNLSMHNFPGTFDSDEEGSTIEEMTKAFESIDISKNFTKLLLKNISPIQRRMLLERNIIDKNYILNLQNVVFSNEDENSYVTLNDIDHLRLSAFKGGLNLQGALDQINRLDSKIEEKLDYAVSLDWGYLNTDVTNSGTGMKASVMLHLPALVETGLIDKALKAVVQIGMSVKGFFSDEDKSLGDMYQISNNIAIGLSEKEIIKKLESIITQIVEYERTARTELFKKQRIDLEDKIMRAYGILKFSKSISSKESIELLSYLRLGMNLGLIEPFDSETINSLLFLTQKAHIQYLINSEETGPDEKLVDYTRAETIRSSLVDTKITGGE